VLTLGRDEPCPAGMEASSLPDLTTFSLADVVQSSSELRRASVGASSMEEAAGRIVDRLYDTMLDGRTGNRALALVRLFKTHPYGALEPDQEKFADGLMGGQTPPPLMKCLTLLATRGEEPEWNDRRSSRGHAAIPLPSETMVGKAPMISQLIAQLGLDVKAILRPDPAMIIDFAQQTYNVFHVAEAKGSPYIPAQADFVLRYGIRSVLGFGGMLPSGNLFATIMFTKTPVPRETADLFANIALAVKLAILPFDGGVTFERASS
jgi:hypothetical protein